MKIRPFGVEEWMNEYEVGAKYNIAETCVSSVSLNELFGITGGDAEKFLKDFADRRLSYGDIEGAPAFKEGVSHLFKTITPDEIVTMHGAAGANHHVFYSLIEPGDEIISIMPTYQQLYSIPEAYGAKVKMLHLRQENNYLPDLDELKALVTPKTKMICLNNPNNPTGALMSTELLKNIIEIARSVNAYVFCDEVYRHLSQKDEWCESVADLYEKGISTGSMSKVFSMAGLRLGWIVTHDKTAIKSFYSHRDYNTVSCGVFDEAVASVALANYDRMLERSRKIVRENLAVLDEWVKSEPRVHYTKPQAGTTALVFYDYDMDSVTFCDRMYHETGAFVTPGACFDEEYCMRIGYCYDIPTIKQGLRAISEFLDILDSEGVKRL